MNKTVAERLNCEEAPFLSNVLQAYEADGNAVGMETTLAIRGLKQTIKALKRSTNESETETLEHIDNNFLDKELAAVCRLSDMGMKVSKSVTSSLMRANRREIVDFGFWYQERVGYLGKQLVEDQNELAAITLDRTSQLVDSSVLPKDARSIMEKSIEWAGPLKPIGSIEQAAMSMDGYCQSDGIGLANLYYLPGLPAGMTPELRQTAFHEYLHGVGAVPRGRRGFFDGVTCPNADIPFRWLEESFVTEVTYMAAELGTNDIEKERLLKPYESERKFLKFLLDNSSKPLDISDLAAAYFSGRTRNTVARKHVHAAINDTLNEIFQEHHGNAWTVSNHIYEVITDRHKRQDFIAGWLDEGTKRAAA